MIKRLFFSWQSDSPTEKAFIRRCLQEICDELDVEYDEDTRNSGAAEFVADVLLRKIRNSGVFVADLTPIGESSKGKKLANPNVCFETGFAECYHSRQQIILTFNEDKATFDDLPFDLSKRVSIRFRGSTAYDPKALKAYKSRLKRAIDHSLKNQKTQERARIVGLQLNRTEETLLYHACKTGDGYISKIVLGSQLTGAIAPGQYQTDIPEQFMAFATERDLKAYTLYQKALGTLTAKHLVTKPSDKRHGACWFVTDDGETQAKRINHESTQALIHVSAIR